MSPRRRVQLALALAAILPLAVPAQAQGVAGDPRLRSRLDSATRVAVEPIIDAARTAGLPVEPLVQKALEGARKRADPSRIAAVVRGLSTELAAARAALGSGAAEPEIVAAAAALHANVGAAGLARLRAARRTGSPLTVPLGALADLIARGVPVDAALTAIEALVARGASPEAYEQLRRDVERSLARGDSPTVAVQAAVGASGPSGGSRAPTTTVTPPSRPGTGTRPAAPPTGRPPTR